MENFHSPQQLGKKAKSSETKAGPDACKQRHGQSLLLFFCKCKVYVPIFWFKLFHPIDSSNWPKRFAAKILEHFPGLL